MQLCLMIMGFWHTLRLRRMYTLLERGQRLPWRLMQVIHGETVLVPMRIKQFLISVGTMALDGFHPTSLIAINDEWAQTPEYGLCVSVPMAENSSLVHPTNVFTVPALFKSLVCLTGSVRCRNQKDHFEIRGSRRRYQRSLLC
jgi:hypothetical protein